LIKLVLDLRSDRPPQTYAEYQPAARKYFNDKELSGEKVQLVIYCYTEEVHKYDFNVMKNHLMARGAKEVNIIVDFEERKE
jgi:hypothetical protein